MGWHQQCSGDGAQPGGTSLGASRIAAGHDFEAVLAKGRLCPSEIIAVCLIASK